MKKINRILIIDNSPGVTGAFKSVYHLTSMLKNSFEFHMALKTKSLLDIVSKQGYIPYTIPFLEIEKSWRLLIYFPQLLINSWRILGVVRKSSITVIHVNDLYNMVGVVVKIFKPRIKLIYNVRLLPNSYVVTLYSIWSRLILRFSDSVICVSEAVYNSLPDSDKKVIIYDATNKISQKPKMDSGQFKFLYPANYIPGKGQNFAVRVFASILSKIPNSHLTFIGGDLDKRKNKEFLIKLKDDVERLGLQNNVTFRDTTDNLTPYYYEADVVIIFSESESFSMICLESLIHGTPVIATRCGGPEEIISHRINGWLVKNRDLDEMSEALVTLYSNTELRNTMTRNTGQIEDKFSIVKSANKLGALYASM